MPDKPGPMSRSLVFGPKSPMTRDLREVAADRAKPSGQTATLAPRVLEALQTHGTIAVGDDTWHEAVAALDTSGEELYRALWNLVLAKRATREVDTDDLGRLRWRFEIAAMDGVK